MSILETGEFSITTSWTPEVIYLKDGWAVVWLGNQIYEQVFDFDGAALGSATRINDTSSKRMEYSDVTALEGGGFVVDWYPQRSDGIPTAVYRQLFDADGHRISNNQRVDDPSSGTSFVHPIAPLSDGGWVQVVDTENRFGQGSLLQTVYNSDGSVRIGAETLSANIETDTGDDGATVTSLTNGGWVVNWFVGNIGPDLYEQVFQQRFRSDGTPIGSVQGIPYLIDLRAMVLAYNITPLSNGGWVTTMEINNTVSYDVLQVAYDKKGDALSRLCEEIDVKVKAFLDRPIEGEWPYVWIDATYLKVRRGGRIVSVAAIIAVGVNADGRRGVLGLEIGTSEAEPICTEFLRKLTRRGLGGVKLVISDAHESIKTAVSKVLNATWQRCRVHFMRNALAHVGKSGRRVVSAFIATAFAQDTPEAASTQWRSVSDQIRPKVPKLATLMDDAENDVLAYMTFPKQNWAKLHSTNPIERLNGEIKRRTEVVGIFPNEDAIIRLVGALLLEQNDEWAVQPSRYTAGNRG